MVLDVVRGEKQERAWVSDVMTSIQDDVSPEFRTVPRSRVPALRPETQKVTMLIIVASS